MLGTAPGGLSNLGVFSSGTPWPERKPLTYAGPGTGANWTVPLLPSSAVQHRLLSFDHQCLCGCEADDGANKV